ncbi:TIMELESS-interacting protein [Terrapene carolina triunguis]|uniref:TIMELESS-interacting protein n=1 Tax=Terrapene triunguis TaxID=2587831 RepID=UPI000CEFBFC0|nr:TIMELESS-interacting protein [Terrapene carolina triunguis]XP_024061289.1 TIMELESS-interacting protein [Terrapene carolina triunguis]
MIDPLANNLFDLPEYDDTEDETFPPLPPPSSPGRDDVEGALTNEEQDGNKPSQTKDSTVSTQKAVKRPIPKLDAQRLISERGLPALRHVFDNAKFKGKGHETEDLKTLLRHMEHWAHRLFPKLQFDDFMERVESLGNKKEVQTCLKRIRLDLPILHEDFTSNEGSGGGNNGLRMSPEEELDPFSQNVKEEFDSHSSTALTEEQQRRIERNRQLALERRQAKMQFNSQSQENDLSATQPNEEFKTIEAQDPDDLTEVEIQAAEAEVADIEAVDKDIQLKCAEEIK